MKYPLQIHATENVTSPLSHDKLSPITVCFYLYTHVSPSLKQNNKINGVNSVDVLTSVHYNFKTTLF